MLKRREFLAAGLGGVLGARALVRAERPPEEAAQQPSDVIGEPGEEIRKLFPRLEEGVFLNAAAGTPLGSFAERGLRQYEAMWRSGPDGGRREQIDRMLTGTREMFARMIGADAGEIAFVHCTKAGEQIVLDGLPKLRAGGNVVTNDMHFGGSLHNLIGLRKGGLDVRIIRGDERDIDIDRMKAAIDDRTALVAVTLVSNINGRIEALPELTDYAQAKGAHVYADIIQAAGVVPIDVNKLGVDFAACSAYKWLYGTFGTGFLYVRRDLQGTVLQDRMFPGYARHDYSPWVATPRSDDEAFLYRAPTDARRYQPGHVSDLGYCALHESLRFLDSVGVAKALAHSVTLCKRLVERVDAGAYPCLSPHVDRSPIVSFRVDNPEKLARRLQAAGITVAFGPRRVRVSPALYNIEADVDALADAMNSAR